MTGKKWETRNKKTPPVVCFVRSALEMQIMSGITALQVMELISSKLQECTVSKQCKLYGFLIFFSVTNLQCTIIIMFHKQIIL